MSDSGSKQDLRFWLDKLEETIDLAHVERTRTLQKTAFAFGEVDHIPTAIHYNVPSEEWPTYGFDEIFADREKMLLNSLQPVYTGMKLRDDRLYGIRADYGTGIIASAFGCETQVFNDTLPIGLHVSPEKLEAILDAGVPDLSAGLLPRVFETAAYYRQQLAPYPKLSQSVGSQLFDIQGPFDNASIIWGSEIFLAFYDAPEKLKRLMDLVTELILAAMRKLREVDGCPLDEQDGGWNFLGGVCVRNDSTINLSSEQYVEFAKPFDSRLIAPHGGWIHWCGRAEQWWRDLLDIPGLKGINPLQGQFHNLSVMFDTCRPAGIPIVQWAGPVNAECREKVRTGFSRITWVSNYDQASRLRDRLHATGHIDE